MRSGEKQEFYGGLPVDIKKEIIANSKGLDALNRGCRPTVCNLNDEYYFVSYSHEDYREVFQDIFDLQEEGVPIFYDQGEFLDAGKDWRKVAQDYIDKDQCLGVIFYISKNSVLSNSIHNEIKEIKSINKPCLTINLEIKEHIKLDGKDMCGKAVSANELLYILEQNGVSISQEKLEVFKDAFYNQVLYLNYNTEASYKKAALESLGHKPLFEMHKIDERRGRLIVGLVSVSKPYIKEITEEDYLDNNKKGLEFEIKSIGACIFANCQMLKSVFIPDSVEDIGPYAFSKCISLKEIDLKSVIHIYESAFERCTSLKQLTLPSSVMKISYRAFKDCHSIEKLIIDARALEIEEEAFSKCFGLKEVVINGDTQKIGTKAFYGCNKLEKITLPDSLEVIEAGAFAGCCLLDSKNFKLPSDLRELGYSAFNGCTSLKCVLIPGSVKCVGNSAFVHCISLETVTIEDGVEEIGESAFGFCKRLKTIYLPKSLTDIRKNAFASCKSLKEIIYGGTVENWISCFKNYDWVVDTGEYVVKCADGKIVTKEEDLTHTRSFYKKLRNSEQ